MTMWHGEYYIRSLGRHGAGRSGKPHILGQSDDGAAVAIGHGDERFARVVSERQLALLMGLGAGKQRLQTLIVKPLEGKHARPRQKRRVELEGWVLRGSADEDDGAVLHVRQEGILLRPVEAMNLVDEEQRSTPKLALGARRLEYFAQIGDARLDRRELLEMKIGLLGKEPRHRGLAGAWRSPEDH